ncbi:non-ribosomal peptide synthetase [Chitinophaga sp. Ak27]|uniref:non-ribosomal peptide synthetase n=1 Tax=Chitinophaga sp. Ak27 TaxID=2726116 RepID=UPI00145FAF75|nr:non-ribosomal peptide synthetase [Chitinophaga sp. Ak27]NLU93274.1 amino acid adenylation domain-containing protein [Chitinophaga sp. Ak27]
MDDITLNIITSQKEKEAAFWNGYVPAGEIASGIQWAKADREGLNGGTRQRYSFAIPEADGVYMLKICKHKPENVHVLLATVMSLLFFKYHGSRLAVVFTPVYNKDAASDGMNTIVPVVTDIGEQCSFFQLLELVQSNVVKVMRHQNFPVLHLWNKIRKEQDSFGQALFAYEGVHDMTMAEENIRDVGFLFSKNGDALTLDIVCKVAYTEQYISHIGEHIVKLLTSLRELRDTAVCQVDIIAAAERKRLLYELNNNNISGGQRTVGEYLDMHASIYPDDIAFEADKKKLSYGMLANEVNSIAAWLGDQGVTAGAPVAVLLERDIALPIVILAIWQLGGIYIPLDIKQPAARILLILKDAQATLLATESLLPAAVKEAYSDHCIYLEKVPEKEGTVRRSYKIASPEETIAYIIYTSGSTGRPKGVLVTQAGMMNHLQGKIADFRIGRNSVIAQHTTQIFDISIWQFFAALVAGGKTVIIADEVVHSPALFIARLNHYAVTHLQVVPAYLVLLLEYMRANHRTWDHLQYLISTGEELPVSLARQWLTSFPGIIMANGYGPTEAADNVLHYIIKDLPGKTVPIGKPLQNMAVYIVDPYMRLCTEGVKGEICVAGPGVGKGYLNQPQKTSLAFQPNPFATPGTAGLLYKTGDIGAWLPDGNICFHGRKDSQVKLSGFRIELGEIEHILGAHPAVKEAAVLLQGNGNNSAFLCAYITTYENVSADALKEYLQQQLPAYMLPAVFVSIADFPRLINGKIDRKELKTFFLDEARDKADPQSEVELVMAKVWKKLFGKAEIGIHDNFFRLGGDSIKAIQLSSRLLNENLNVSIKDIFNYPTISGLAMQAVKITQTASQDIVEGMIPLTPLQKHFFSLLKNYRHHFNQAVMLLLRTPVTTEDLLIIARKLQIHHDSLRMVFQPDDNGILQENKGADYPVSVTTYDLTEEENYEEVSRNIADRIQASINLTTGPLMKMALLKRKDGDRLLIVIHHMVTDGVSWRILLEDLDLLLEQQTAKLPLSLPYKTDSFKTWVNRLSIYTAGAAFETACVYWRNNSEAVAPFLVKDCPSGTNRVKDVRQVTFTLNSSETRSLLTQAGRSFGANTPELLLAALMLAVNKGFGFTTLKVDLEGHGREMALDGVNITRTVGWFTSIYPVVLEMPEEDGYPAAIVHNKTLLRRIPNNGFDYALFADNGRLFSAPLVFNYLGQFDTDISTKHFKMAGESTGRPIAPDANRSHPFEMVAVVDDKQLSVSIYYSGSQYYREKIDLLMTCYKESLTALIACCEGLNKTYLLPADLHYKGLTIPELDALQQQYAIQDIYPLSSAQEGILYHTLLHPSSPDYFVQCAYRVEGTIEPAHVRQAFEQLIAKHDVLRTRFLYTHGKQPLQMVLRDGKGEYEWIDVTAEVAQKGHESVMKSYCSADRERNFDVSKDILIRLTVLQMSANDFEFIWSFHHLLMDGWCTALLVNEFLLFYLAFLAQQEPALMPVEQYGAYISWLEKQDSVLAAAYWRNYISGFEQVTVLPGRLLTGVAERVTTKDLSFNIGSDITLQLKELSNQAEVTLYTLLQTAWGILLAYYNNNRDVVFGSVVSGRPPEVPGIENMIGLFINTIPVRVTFDADTRLFDLYRRLQHEALDSNRYDFYALARIQSESQAGNQLVNHIFVFENYPLGEEITTIWNAGAAGSPRPFRLVNVEVSEQTNYDLSVIVSADSDIHIRFQYDESKFNNKILPEMAARFRQILEQLALAGDTNIAAVDPLLQEEKTGLNIGSHNSNPGYPLEQTVTSLFSEQVRQHAERAAVIFNGNAITFKELDERSSRLSSLLLQRQAIHSTIIGILMERSIDTVVAIMGILKAGAAYLPVSSRLPQSRIKYMLSDSGCSTVITNRHLKALLEEDGREVVIIEELPATTIDVQEVVAENQSSTDLIYMIYTSGSSGNPKGVRVMHKNVVNLVYGLNETIFADYGPGIRMALVSPFDFDASVQHLFGALLLGHTVFIVPEEARADGYLLMDFFTENNIMLTDGTPTHLRLCLETGMAFAPSLQHFLIAGEELPKRIVDEFYSRGNTARITNLYGPTETCVDSTFFHIIPGETDQWEKIPIGEPLPNQSVYILDKDQRPLPPGIHGEIYIGGTGVAKGYHNKEHLTEEKFIPNPFVAGDRLYRTGDLGQRLATGHLFYEGRIDSQVKIRGFRIEPGEITKQLQQLDGIREAVVVTKEFNDSVRLMAFYVSDRQYTTGAIRDFCEKHLPYYMIPSYFIKIDSIPLTANNKTDIKALLAYDVTGHLKRDTIAPRNQSEMQLAAIWTKVLGIEEVGVDNSFFEIGGNSLDLVRVYGMMKTEMNFSGSLIRLVEYPTIRLLAAFLTENVSATESIHEEQIVISRQKKLQQRSLRNIAGEDSIYEN